MIVVRYVYVLLLAIWLGSVIFLSFVLAPTAFSVLPTRELAGRLVGATLKRFYTLSYVVLTLMLICGIVLSKARANPLRHFLSTNVLIILVLLVTVCTATLVSKKMEDLRTQMGSIDSVPPNDPLRIEFNRLHKVSVLLTGTSLLFGLVQLFIGLRS